MVSQDAKNVHTYIHTETKRQTRTETEIEREMYFKKHSKLI